MKLKYTLGTLEYVRYLASTNVLFRPTTLQMPNLALIETKQIAMHDIFMQHSF
jgi:hypothetical protein